MEARFCQGREFFLDLEAIIMTYLLNILRYLSHYYE